MHAPRIMHLHAFIFAQVRTYRCVCVLAGTTDFVKRGETVTKLEVDLTKFRHVLLPELAHEIIFKLADANRFLVPPVCWHTHMHLRTCTHAHMLLNSTRVVHPNRLDYSS
jgi:hypothetical protein